MLGLKGFEPSHSVHCTFLTSVTAEIVEGIIRMICSIKQYLKDGTTMQEASSEVSLETLSFAFAETQHIR